MILSAVGYNGSYIKIGGYTLRLSETAHDGAPYFYFEMTNSAEYTNILAWEYNGSRAYSVTGGINGIWRQI